MSSKIILPLAIILASLGTYYIYNEASKSNKNIQIPKQKLFKENKVKSKNIKEISNVKTKEYEPKIRPKIKEESNLEKQLKYDYNNKIYANNGTNISKTISNIIRKEITKEYKNKNLYLDYYFEVKFYYLPNKEISIYYMDSSNIEKNRKKYIQILEKLRYKFPKIRETTPLYLRFKTPYLKTSIN